MNERSSADAYCRMLAARHYENFAVASRIVPQPLRADLMRFYAFCRTTDDLGDESGTTQAALQRLTSWRSQTQEFFGGLPPVHPVFIALRETVDRHRLDETPFVDLIAANEQDQRIFFYETWPQLQAYCMLSAAPVGRVVLKIFATDNARAVQLSDDVCIGLQLANHAQDVSRDRAIGRSYLLQDDLTQLGFPGAVAALVARARTLLASGEELEGMVPGALRAQLALYRLGGLAICDEIERIGFRTDVRRPCVSKRTKMVLAMRALVNVAKR